MITDTHCHIFSFDYYNPLMVFDNLERDNIKRIVNNGYDMKSNRELIDYLKYNNVYGALGIHPDNISDFDEDAKKFIEENILNERIVAIGEIGLDYYHNNLNKEEQINMLEYFLDLAEKVNKPVIIHNREATGDLLNVLKRHNCCGIIHCLSGSLESARDYIKLGYKLGIGGVVTFKNSKLKDILLDIGLENILLETDSPYLTPVPFRGVSNEPYNINYVFNFVRDLFNVSDEYLVNILEKNYQNIFMR